ncbi:hypothetical protein [Actinopolymorpha sp. B9G3]|jgi:hypothetical protein
MPRHDHDAGGPADLLAAKATLRDDADEPRRTGIAKWDAAPH